MKRSTYKSFFFSVTLLFLCVGGYAIMNSDTRQSDHITNLSNRSSPLRDMYYDKKLFHGDEDFGAKKNVDPSTLVQKEKTQMTATVEKEKVTQMEAEKAVYAYRATQRDNALRGRSEQKQSAQKQESVVQNSSGAQVVQVVGNSNDIIQSSVVQNSSGAQVVQVGQNYPQDDEADDDFEW